MLFHFENEYVKYCLKNGILEIEYKEEVYIDLKAGVQIVKDRLELHKGQTLPVLCDMRGIREINKSARDYLAIEGSVLIKAVAFIHESYVSKMISGFYLRTNTPSVPTKTFDNVSDGLVFLNKFL
ncbi:hypothetical protein [uncultured Polaribacter sp.]|uniref:DUF7793 family protein n=1 Tax=uncultured Polaribacter sp. TaxID=174711 RepID=UPI00260DDCD9|nr:hypothetical protein [uncultured Polaribacter sp.]